MLSSMERRVLAPQPSPNPLITGRLAGGEVTYVVALPQANHCLALQLAGLIELGWIPTLCDTPPKEPVGESILPVLLTPHETSLPPRWLTPKYSSCPSLAQERATKLCQDGTSFSSTKDLSRLCGCIHATIAQLESHSGKRSVLSGGTESLVAISMWPVPSTSNAKAPASRALKGYHPLAPVHQLVRSFISEKVLPPDHLQPLPFDEWVSRYPLRRRTELAQARENVLARGGLLPTDAIVKTFVKMETSTSLTDPRNISPRSDEFLSVIGPYISAIEHALHDAPFLVKGVNLAGRDKKMTPLLDFHTFLETDYSRFDMTISLEWLECVQDEILTGFFPQDHLFSQALKLARKTKGVSECGLHYLINGTRCSGDAHTSIANGLLNAFNTWSVFSDVPEDCWATWHEGDDGITAFTKDWAYVAGRAELMDSFGFKVKALVTKDLLQTTFCGRFFADTPDGLRSFADPLRTLSKIHTTLSQGRLQDLLMAKGLSYAYTDGATPIIGPFCRAIIRLGEMRRQVFKFLRADRYLLFDEELADIAEGGDASVDPALRVAFALRTGIAPADQERIEDELRFVLRDCIPGRFDKFAVSSEEWGTDDKELHFMPTLHHVA